MEQNNKQIKKLMTYRWLVWGALCLAFVVVYFHRVAPAVVADNLMSEFGITGVALGNLGAVYSYVYMVMQIPSGVLADTLGPRKTVAIGLLVSSMGSIIFGLAPGITLGCVGRFFVGLGASVVYIAILKIQSQWFKQREFGTMSGLTGFIGNGGAVLAGTPLAIAVTIYSWRTVFIAIGVVNIVIALLSYIIVRNKPQDMGLPSIARLEGREVSEGSKKPDIVKNLKTVISNKCTWPVILILASMFGSLIAFTGIWGVPYLMTVYQFDKTRASSYTMIAMIGVMIGAIIAGTVSDRLGKRKLPFLIYGTAYFLVWLVLVFWNGGKPPAEVLYPLFFLMGLTASGYTGCWAVGKEVNPPKFAGTAMGTVNTGSFFGASIMQPLMGYVLDKNWTGQIINGSRIYSQMAYQKAFMLCLVAAGIVIICSLFVKETNCTNIYHQLKKDSNQ